MIIPVILAGASGTRLWPLSRKLYPKQLMNLVDTHTMLAHGSKRWQLVTFSILMLVLGLWLWNGTGKVLGFGSLVGPDNSRYKIRKSE